MKTGLSIVFVLTFIVILLFVSFANAEFAIKDYDNLKDVGWFRTYITGVGVGTTWANTELQSRGQPPLYCLPGKLVLETQNYMRILQGSIEKHKDIIKLDTPVEMLLLEGLMETFPCKK